MKSGQYIGIAQTGCGDFIGFKHVNAAFKWDSYAKHDSHTSGSKTVITLMKLVAGWEAGTAQLVDW